MISLKLAAALMLFAVVFPVRAHVLYGNKTFSIAGIFNIYTSATRAKVNPQIGIHFQEAYRFALQEINKNKSILHGFQLTEEVATTEKWNTLVTNILFKYYALNQAPTAVGPYESLDAFKLSILTNGIGYPLVSYAASSDDVEESGSSYFRTVPTDSFRVMAAVEILRKLRWNYVAIISSHAQNGDKMAKDFVKKSSQFDICYSTQTSLANRAKTADYKQAIQIAANDAQAKGLILFTTISDSVGLINQLKVLNLTSRFQIVAATGSTNYVEVTNGNEAVLEGSISLVSAIREMPKFRNYFLSLNTSSRKSKEFKLFWEQTFECKLEHSNKSKTPSCTGAEKLSVGKGYYPNTPIPLVIDSIYALALAYKYIIEKSCRNKAYCNWDPSESNYYIGRLRDFLRANSFADNTLNFTNPITNQDPYLVEYEVLNYVKTRAGYENRKVGKWLIRRNGYTKRGSDYLWSAETGTTQMNASEVRWKENKHNVVSSCRLPCRSGEVHQQSSLGIRQKCCWTCIPCKNTQVTVNNTCRNCQDESKPDTALKSCVKITRRSFRSHTTSFIAVRVYLGFSALGILATIFVAIVFIKNNNNPIVRASGRDLCYFILAGIALTFAIPVTYYIEPDRIVCAIRGIIPGMAFCMCYSPLFLKTNRIYRIFQNAQTTISRPPLVSPQSQLIILFCILCVQVLLGVAWVISNSSSTLHTFIPPSRDYIAFFCGDDIAPVTLNLLLSVVFMVCCTWYAFKTRNFPKNYNESKYIGLTMYITCICWAVFLPTYFISTQSGNFVRAHLMCIIAVCIGFLNLVGLFGQKIKHLLFPCLVDNSLANRSKSQTSKEHKENDNMKIHKLDALSICKGASAEGITIANGNAR